MKDASVPLAVLGPQCAFRKAAVQQLEDARIPYRITATSTSDPPTLPVVLHRGSNAATPAIDALHALIGTATQGALAGLTPPQRLSIRRQT